MVVEGTGRAEGVVISATRRDDDVVEVGVLVVVVVLVVVLVVEVVVEATEINRDWRPVKGIPVYLPASLHGSDSD